MGRDIRAKMRFSPEVTFMGNERVLLKVAKVFRIPREKVSEPGSNIYGKIKPKLLLADEPTTSLDLTIQASVLEEFKMLRDHGASILLVTHDLGVVAQMADYVYVMNDGEIVEEGTVFDIFDHPKHPYTCELLECGQFI